MTEPADPASKTRVVPAPGSAPPEWAQELFQSIVDLRNQVAALRLGPTSPPAAPTYPPQLTPEALGLLGQDPCLPDFLKPLLPLLAYTVTLTDERAPHGPGMPPWGPRERAPACPAGRGSAGLEPAALGEGLGQDRPELAG